MTVCVRSRAIHCSSRRCQSRSNVRGWRLAVRPGLRCQKGWRFPIRSRLDCAHRRREAGGACRTRPTDRPFGQRRRRWWTLIIVAPTTLVQSIERGNGVASSAPVHVLLKQFCLKQFVKRRTSTSLASEACVRDFYRTVSETGHVEPFLAIKFQVHLTGHCRLSSTDQPVTKFLFVFGSNHHPSTDHHASRNTSPETPPLSPFTREARAPVSRPRLLVRVYSSFRPAFVCAANKLFGTSVKSHENEAGSGTKKRHEKRIRDLSRGPCTVAPIHTFTHRHHDCAEYLAT